MYHGNPGVNSPTDRMTEPERLHLDMVADLGCIVCRNQGVFSPAAIHHIRKGKGLGQRSDHWHVLPLCPPHHQTGPIGIAFHAGRKTWEERYGHEDELLAQVKKLLEEKWG